MQLDVYKRQELILALPEGRDEDIQHDAASFDSAAMENIMYNVKFCSELCVCVCMCVKERERER